MPTDHRELRSAGLFAAILSAYAACVLASGRVAPGDLALLTATYIGGAMALWAALGLIGLLIMLVRHGVGPVDAPRVSPFVLIARFLRERWQRDHGVSLLMPPAMLAVLIATFNAFKQMILVTAPFRLDPLLARIDRALFLGHDPWTFTHAIAPWPVATYIIDHGYHGWFVPMTLGLVLCAWGSRASFHLRTQYVLTYLAVWIVIGSVIAYILPAAGPCYYAAFGNGATFDPLIAKLTGDQAAMREMLPGATLMALKNQAGLLHLYGSRDLAIGGGISAMPSVHNALSTLFALAAFRISRTLGRVALLYAVLIWFGSIDLGWHYAIDGIVAIVLTIALWRVAGRVASRLEQPLWAPLPLGTATA